MAWGDLQRMTDGGGPGSRRLCQGPSPISQLACLGQSGALECRGDAAGGLPTPLLKHRDQILRAWQAPLASVDRGKGGCSSSSHSPASCGEDEGMAALVTRQGVGRRKTTSAHRISTMLCSAWQKRHSNCMISVSEFDLFLSDGPFGHFCCPRTFSLATNLFG